MRKIGSYALTFIVALVVCILAIKLSKCAPALIGSSDKQAVIANLESPAPPHERVSTESTIAKAAAVIMPSVVTVQVDSKTTVQPQPNFFFFGPFGQQSPHEQSSHAVGSGIIISDDGYIVTNNHVIYGASGGDNVAPERIWVTLDDGSVLPAKIIGADAHTDIGVIKIVDTKKKLVAAKFADSKDARVGDMVIAVGNPLNIGTSVSHGIISAIGHRNSSVTGDHVDNTDIIQTDAAINHGNSGGALADMDGHVVGLNEAIVSNTDNFIGIGLAIPSNRVKDVVKQIIETGKVIHPTITYIGVQFMPLRSIDPDMRSSAGITIDGDNGAVVMDVMPNSPAEKAGLKVYDVILDVNGKPLASNDDSLRETITKLKPGDKILLRVARGNDVMPVKIIAAARPDNLDEIAQKRLEEKQHKQQQQEQQDQPQQQQQQQFPQFPFGTP